MSFRGVARIAKGLGAAAIGLYVQESLLTETCDYNIRYESIAVDESRAERVNSTIALNIAMQLTAMVEGYENIADAERAFAMVDGIYRRAVESCAEPAARWAEQNKNEPVIYILASGPSMGAAYIFGICNVEKMLQKDAPIVNCCEFFHGPFEAVGRETPVFLLRSAGRTRPLDDRAVDFLSKYGGEKVYVLDAEAIGIGDLPGTVSEYFHHVLFTPVLNNVYMRALSKATGKDYNTRRYMWQFAY